MIHTMSLRERPFSQIESGAKTIELRLYDEKRQAVRVGDSIVFTHADHPERTMRTTVIGLHIFPTFDDLYRALPLERCGYTAEEAKTACARDMDAYYTPEQQAQYRVIGIEITRV